MMGAFIGLRRGAGSSTRAEADGAGAGESGEACALAEVSRSGCGAFSRLGAGRSPFGGGGRKKGSSRLRRSGSTWKRERSTVSRSKKKSRGPRRTRNARPTQWVKTEHSIGKMLGRRSVRNVRNSSSSGTGGGCGTKRDRMSSFRRFSPSAGDRQEDRVALLAI